MSEKERYATIATWAEHLQEEGYVVSESSIRNRLREAEAIGRTARSKLGHLKINGYFSESAVREACHELLQELPRADDKGFFELNGQLYGTKSGLEKLIKVTSPIIKLRISVSDLAPVKGRARSGQIIDYYPVEGVRRLFEDRADQSLPESNEDGLLVCEGQRRGTKSALAKLLGLKQHIVNRKVNNSELVPIKGRANNGKIADFYAEAEVRELLVDDLMGLPEENEQGFFLHEGEPYRTLEGLKRELGVSYKHIKRKISQAKLRPIRGKDQVGHTCKFFSEANVRGLCQEHLEPIQQAGKEGFLVYRGKRYATRDKLRKLFDISMNAICKRIDASSVTPIKGKMRNGQIYDCYPEPAVRKLCADLIAKKSKKR